MTVSAAPNKKQQKQFKTDIENVKTNLKKNKDLEKSETLLRKYLADSTYANDKSLHLLLVESIKKQYESLNEKMYLKQKVDTATVVKTNIRGFLANEKLDSLDALPDKNGKIELLYREKHAEILTPYWGNLLKGGIFFYAHSKWDDAWQSLDTYLSVRNKPLFSNTQLDTTQVNFASFLATMSACKLNDLDKALVYAEDAKKYTPRKEVLLKSLAQLNAEKGKMNSYADLLEEGFHEYPYSDFFFINLIDYHVKADNIDKALMYADEAISRDSLYEPFMLAQHTVLMQMGKYDEAQKVGLSLLAINDSLPLVTYNVGYIYYLRAQDILAKKTGSLKQRLKGAQIEYKNCLPYIERYRQFAPDDKTRWRNILYETYLSLNMGREFDSLPSE